MYYIYKIYIPLAELIVLGVWTYIAVLWVSELILWCFWAYTLGVWTYTWVVRTYTFGCLNLYRCTLGVRTYTLGMVSLGYATRTLWFYYKRSPSIHLQRPWCAMGKCIWRQLQTWMQWTFPGFSRIHLNHYWCFGGCPDRVTR